MGRLRIVAVRAGGYVDDAACIWAEATSAREGDPDVASLEVARRKIEAVLSSSPRSLLLVAVARESRALGFAAVEPADASDRAWAKVRYLAVDPRAWGQGVATALLGALPDRLTDAGFRAARLTVYVDNSRAVEVYRRAGWCPRGAPRPHATTTKLEQLYELEF